MVQKVFKSGKKYKNKVWNYPLDVISKLRVILVYNFQTKILFQLQKGNKIETNKRCPNFIYLYNPENVCKNILLVLN